MVDRASLRIIFKKSLKIRALIHNQQMHGQVLDALFFQIYQRECLPALLGLLVNDLLCFAKITSKYIA